MKFNLYESIPQVDYRSFTDSFNKAEYDVRDEIITNFVQQYKKPDLLNILDAFRLSITQKGFDPNTNEFLSLVDKLSFKTVTPNQISNFYHLAGLAAKNQIDLRKDYLTRREIYNVNPKEFNYVVNLFDIVNTPTKLNKFFKNAENISEDQLYDEKGNIKPVGKEGDGTETLFGTVESWSGNDGENDNPDTIETRSDEKSKNVTQKELAAARQKPYESIEVIPSEECKEGNIVFVKFRVTGNKRHGKYTRQKINAYYMYSRGTWARIN